MDFVTNINWAAPSWDLFIILFFIVAAFLYGLSLGRNRVIVILVSIYMIAVTYRSMLCTYNKILVWSFLGINILNKLCQEILTPDDFELYINIYFPALLVPTTIAVTYYLIKSYDPK